MRNVFRTLPPVVMAIAVAMPVTSKVSDKYPVPASDADGVRGATMPYTRYDCNAAGEAALGGGATLKTAPDWDPANRATQASKQAYVDMPVGGSVAWTMTTNGDGVTVRYTIADSNAGSMGRANGWKSSEGELEIYVNGQLDKTVPLTSYYMYQYFNFGGGTPSRGQASGDVASFAFDEKHVRLSKMLRPGDEIKLVCKSGRDVGVDFVEIEVVPEPIEPSEIAGGRQVFNVTDYGASLNSTDNRAAFTRAVNAANRVGGVVFIPEGTWLMGYSDPGNTENQQGLWSINPKDIMITGAGMWYTNVQFTGWGRFGGGVSGGNPSNTGGNNVSDNVEFCNMYLNSNLCDRYGENAVYKGIMDIWCGGSAFHDVWVEHFECGFWLGDYNDATARCSDDLRIFDCRIRNNFADGVNFCLGTSRAAVFNCSVRNNGDDGLACWNDSKYGAKDETGNVFAYNTIDLIWRAGAVAIYGGIDPKVYNNYICDTFMASGLHLNSTFDGHKFNGASSTHPIVFENNYLVRTGTLRECWGRNYAAIDIEGDVHDVVFRNNHIYDSPAESIRIMNSIPGLVVDGLYVSGSGVSNGTIPYSGWNYNPAVGCFPNGGNSGNWKNFQIVKGSVPAQRTGWQYKTTWPFWESQPASWTWVNADDVKWAEVPPYPDAKGIEPPVDIFATLSDYDVVLTGIDWLTDKNQHLMNDGDKVTFRVRIDNAGNVDIPAENAKFAVRLSIDGTTSYSHTVKEGLAAGESRVIEFTTPWTATAGSHAILAEVDPAGKMVNENNRDNNTRSKAINVNAVENSEDPIVINTHRGTDVGVVKVYFAKEERSSMNEVAVGETLIPHAIVANFGTTPITLGKGKGFLWGFNGTAEYNTGMLWNDQTITIESGKYVDITPNGGGSASGSLESSTDWTNDYKYKAKQGPVSLFGRMDNPGQHNDDTADNNSVSAEYTFPILAPSFIENPDRADNLVTGGTWPYENETEAGISEIDAECQADVWFTITGVRVSEPTAPGIYIHNGKKVLVK